MESKTNISRETAKICPIKTLLNGKYILQEGWEPNYVQTPFGRISRINVMGVVVGIESSVRFLLDDGTSTIKVNDFSSLIQEKNLKVGDLVLIIARIREFENELCLVSEIINKDQLSKNPEWFKFRKKYLDLMLQNQPEEDLIPIETKPTPEIIEFQTPSLENLDGKNISDKIIDFIRNYDSKVGCPFDEIVNKFKEDDAEDLINSLIAMGEIYEIKAGYLKVLE